MTKPIVHIRWDIQITYIAVRDAQAVVKDEKVR